MTGTDGIEIAKDGFGRGHGRRVRSIESSHNDGHRINSNAPCFREPEDLL